MNAKNHTTGFVTLVQDAKTRIKEIDVALLKKMIEQGEPTILIDVREESEWNSGHVKGALHISKGVIERDIETKIPDKNKTLVLYCGGGFRSALAADNLRKMNYLNVISLDGGWRALKESGMELE
jgi:rhodanese-related sulfurtransferase